MPTVILVDGARTPTGPYTLESDSLGMYSPAIQPGAGAWAGVGGQVLHHVDREFYLCCEGCARYFDAHAESVIAARRI